MRSMQLKASQRSLVRHETVMQLRSSGSSQKAPQQKKKMGDLWLEKQQKQQQEPPKPAPVQNKPSAEQRGKLQEAWKQQVDNNVHPLCVVNSLIL